MKDGTENIRYLLMDINGVDYESLTNRFLKLHQEKELGNTLTIRECVNPNHRIVKVVGKVGWLETEKTKMDMGITNNSILAVYGYTDIPLVKSLLKPNEDTV